MNPNDDATRLLQRLADGDRSAAEALLPVVHDELRRLAGKHMREQRPGHTLQPTALLHEAYLRLVERESGFEGRDHFLAVASRAMRSILVDHARARKAKKRGDGFERVALDDVVASFEERAIDLEALDGALERLASASPRAARVVELRFFGGLDNEAAARVMDVSTRTLEREWRSAKAWLHKELG